VSLTIGVDIGATKVLGGIVDPAGKVLEICRRPTPADDAAAARDVIIEVVRELSAGREVEAVASGRPAWSTRLARPRRGQPQFAVWRGRTDRCDGDRSRSGRRRRRGGSLQQDRLLAGNEAGLIGAADLARLR
jgi:predicted NBD/HSP70 family sugar kinase